MGRADVPAPANGSFAQGGDTLELSQLTAYAEEKFHIREQHKWADFPGFSVLADPSTGKWLALLMRQWDSDTGTEIQRCDIKCGRENLLPSSELYLSLPFRMKGNKWVGVQLDERTKPEVVFRLFDRAVYASEKRGYTMVLETPPTTPMVVYQDTALPASGTPIPATDVKIPNRIRNMMRLYQYQGGSFAWKCKNFYRQGKFMEDYEDDAPWTGTYRHYFPTYHDLNLPQLRGYFTWRTRVRKGEFTPIATSLAYIYLYELLNGIGTSSPEDSLQKMEEFETGFLDSGIGDPEMGKNLRRWMLEYAVLHNIPPAQARRYANPILLERDAALTVLKYPTHATDQQVFDALCAFAGTKLEQSSVVKKEEEKGKHLFAAVWREAWATYSQDGKDLFTACFGEEKSYRWHPLANAVYWEEHPHPDADYILDVCRTYHCRDGRWREKRYDTLYFRKEILSALLHETDRLLRKQLKTGHYLHEKPEEAWATPYVERALAAQRQAELEAARPKITIDLSHLDQIRQDASITRDSLLTQEEMDDKGNLKEEEPQTEQPAQPIPPKEEPEPASGALAALDPTYRQILLALLRKEPIQPYLKAHHLMPSIVADGINEVLFDQIGDNVLEWDGDTITVVEDYQEDLLQLIGGNNP